MECLEGNALLLQIPLVEFPLVESNLGGVNIQMNYHSDIPLESPCEAIFNWKCRNIYCKKI